MDTWGICLVLPCEKSLQKNQLIQLEGLSSLQR